MSKIMDLTAFPPIMVSIKGRNTRPLQVVNIPSKRQGFQSLTARRYTTNRKESQPISDSFTQTGTFSELFRGSKWLK